MGAHPPAPLILGLTGPIACGKTTVGTILLQLGALARIDADQIVHRLYEPGMPVSREIAAAFGPEMLAPDGSVDRGRLGDVVFGHPEQLRRLEGIVHPAVRAAVRQELAQYHGKPGVVVIDAVRLLQSDLLPLCDAVWVVQCPEEAELRRLRRNRGLDEAAARARLAAQPSFDHPAVTRIIHNDGTRQALRAEVELAWTDLTAR